ncbi:hypothetical protein KC217_23815, partial [Mycobacterium tuberculosis]|nr:hypothetical protein [Mycobacterium tuberculosis]
AALFGEAPPRAWLWLAWLSEVTKGYHQMEFVKFNNRSIVLVLVNLFLLKLFAIFLQRSSSRRCGGM